MAALTVSTEFAPMHVVAAMAAATIRGHAETTVRGALVTRGAAESHVAAVEFKRCLPVVIERPQRPVDRVVAIAAGGTERHAVFVILAMAIDTFAGRILKTRALVTTGAFGLAVRPDQRETRQAVIENDRLGPASLTVALRTGAPELPRVRILVSVTTEATVGRARLPDRGLVAERTFDFRMRADEFEIGVTIVLETHDGPRVCRVTTAAVTTVQAVVFVVFAMAGETIAGQADFEDRTGVTVGATLASDMLARQREIGL